MKTLLIDVDPQGSVRYGAGLQRGHPTAGFADYLNGERTLREIILPTALPWLRVILAGSVADEADHALYSQLVQETDVLQDLLQMAEQRCQVVVVDTPPGLGSITRKVLGGSEHVIVPLQCEPLALQTTPQILRAIQDIVAVNERLTLDGILLTMYEPNNPASDRVVDYVRRHLPSNIVFDVLIPRTSATADAFAAGQPVVVRSPADAASQAYVNLATLLADRLV
jgi:chromosome partitioning protein